MCIRDSHCMESSDDCMNFDNQLDCMNQDGCYWMGDHCMAGSNCTDPIAFNYNPISDIFEKLGLNGTLSAIIESNRFNFRLVPTFRFAYCGISDSKV